LGEYLENAVGERLLQLQIDKDQAPTFEVQYGDRNLHWLARILVAGRGLTSPWSGVLSATLLFAIPANTRSLSEIASDLVATIIERPDQFTAELDRACRRGLRPVFAESVTSLAPAFLKLASRRGSGSVVATYPTRTRRRPAFDSTHNTCTGRIMGPGRPTNVFLRLGNDTVSVLPVLPGYTTDVHIEGQQIVAVSFEQTHLPVRKAEQVRRLRAVVTASVNAVASGQPKQGWMSPAGSKH